MLRAWVRKYAKGKRSGGWLRMRVDSIAFCFLFWLLGRIESGRVYYGSWWSWNFNFEKVNLFFLLLNSHWEWQLAMKALVLKYMLWVLKSNFKKLNSPFYFTRQEREREREMRERDERERERDERERERLWDFVVELQDEFAYSPKSQHMQHMPSRNYVLLQSLEEGIFQTRSPLLSFSNLDYNRKKEKKTLPPALQSTERKQKLKFWREKNRSRDWNLFKNNEDSASGLFILLCTKFTRVNFPRSSQTGGNL